MIFSKADLMATKRRVQHEGVDFIMPNFGSLDGITVPCV